MIKMDFFDDDERQYLNSIVKDRDREKLKRKDVLSNIAFAREVADHTDEMVTELIDGLYSKINTMSDEEWENLRMQLPFPVNINFEDNIDEVPIDESGN